MNLVASVRAPVGHFAARVGSPLHPIELKLAVEGPFGGLSLPHVPIIALWNRFFGQSVVSAWTGIVDRQHDLELANAASSNQLAREPVHFHRALLRSDLEHPAVLPDRSHQRAAFGDGQRERLFRVNVQAGLAGMNAWQNPAVVRRGDDDRVELFGIEHLAVVLVRAPVGFLFGQRLLHAADVTVRDGHDSGGILGQVIHELPRPSPSAYETDNDSLVRPADGWGYNLRRDQCPEGHGASTQKPTPAQLGRLRRRASVIDAIHNVSLARE